MMVEFGGRRCRGRFRPRAPPPGMLLWRDARTRHRTVQRAEEEDRTTLQKHGDDQLATILTADQQERSSRTCSSAAAAAARAAASAAAAARAVSAAAEPTRGSTALNKGWGYGTINPNSIQAGQQQAARRHHRPDQQGRAAQSRRLGRAARLGLGRQLPHRLLRSQSGFGRRSDQGVHHRRVALRQGGARRHGL